MWGGSGAEREGEVGGMGNGGSWCGGMGMSRTGRESVVGWGVESDVWGSNGTYERMGRVGFYRYEGKAKMDWEYFRREKGGKFFRGNFVHNHPQEINT